MARAQRTSENEWMHSIPDASPLHPFATLTPDVVLDALASVGLYGDGRLMALSSYENRVYQVTLEDGSRVVAKFYRPERWSEAQILEEHAFAAELMAAEVPAVGPLVLEGRTLHPHGGFQFSVSPWRGGRQPELDDFEVLEWIGRFLARIHTVGAARPFAARPGPCGRRPGRQNVGRHGPIRRAASTGCCRGGSRRAGAAGWIFLDQIGLQRFLVVR